MSEVADQDVFIGQDVVIGVDGCPGGWVGTLVPILQSGADYTAQFAEAHVRLFKTFAEIPLSDPHLLCVAVDIPIGLPDRAGTGGRSCDVQARKVLGARQSAIFSMPSRDAVMCSDYREACDVALATSDPPRKISKQAFHLFPKIREVDTLLSPELQRRVVECHPEVAFWALNGETALDTPKKVKSRPNPDGIAFRRQLLESVGYSTALLEGQPFPRSKVGADDILDACVNAWSALRIVQGEAKRFPEHPETDRLGLRMEIWG